MTKKQLIDKRIKKLKLIEIFGLLFLRKMYIQIPIKRLKWSVLQKLLTDKSRYLFWQSTAS